ncbi:MAG: hypothetical protein WDW38_007037 [Sanguina aurantia]
MRRADRLFLIIHALRGRRTALQARQLAQTLGVSQRTVYRDVADLQLSAFRSRARLASATCCARDRTFRRYCSTPTNSRHSWWVRASSARSPARGWPISRSSAHADHRQARAATGVSRERAAAYARFAPVWRDQHQSDFALMLDRLHAAIIGNHVLQLEYRDEAGRSSAREIEPLCLSFWGGAWTLGAWCRLRLDFRNFRPDRIDTCAPTGEIRVDCAERNLASYLRAVGAEMLDIN